MFHFSNFSKTQTKRNTSTFFTVFFVGQVLFAHFSERCFSFQATEVEKEQASELLEVKYPDESWLICFEDKLHCQS